jgi:hypothetical protein
LSLDLSPWHNILKAEEIVFVQVHSFVFSLEVLACVFLEEIIQPFCREWCATERPHSADIELAIAKYLSKASACYMGVMKSGEIKQPSFAFMIQGTEKQNLERMSLRNMFWQRIGTAFCRKREEARALLQDSLSFTATHVDDHSMQQPMSAEPILMETLYSTQKSIPSQTFGYGQTQSFQLWGSSLPCLL